MVIDKFTVHYIEQSQLPYSDSDNVSFYQNVTEPGSSRSANLSHLVPGTVYVFRVFYTSEWVYTSDWSRANCRQYLSCK